MDTKPGFWALEVFKEIGFWQANKNMAFFPFCFDKFSKLSMSEALQSLALHTYFWQIPATNKSDFMSLIHHYHLDTCRIRITSGWKNPENSTQLIFSSIFKFIASRGKVAKVFLGLNVDWFAMKMIKWTVIVIWIQKPQQFHQEWISFKQKKIGHLWSCMEKKQQLLFLWIFHCPPIIEILILKYITKQARCR